MRFRGRVALLWWMVGTVDGWEGFVFEVFPIIWAEEEVLPDFHQSLALVFTELAVRVEWLEFFCFEVSAQVFVFGEMERGAAEAGEGVEQTSVVGGIRVEFAIEVVGRDFSEGLEDLGGGNLEDDVREFGLAAGKKHVESELLLGAEFFEPLVFALPVGEAALFPFGDVVFGKTFCFRAEFLEDVFVGRAVIEHLANGIAGSFGKAGNVSVAMARFGGFARVSGGLGLGVGLWGGREALRDWAHFGSNGLFIFSPTDSYSLLQTPTESDGLGGVIRWVVGRFGVRGRTGFTDEFRIVTESKVAFGR